MLGYHGFTRARNFAGETAALIAAEERADRAQRALERVKSKSEQATEMLVQKALVVGTAGGLGFWQGYKGKMPEVLGVGLDLVIGAGASAAALFADEMGIGKYSHYLDAVGTGALAFWAANQGNMYGVKKAEGEGSEADAGGIDGDEDRYLPGDRRVRDEQRHADPLHGFR